MIQLLNYAHLAGEVYHPGLGGFSNLTITDIQTSQIPQTMRYPGFYRLIDVDRNQSPSKPFFAQLYVKFEAGRASDAVMAIRGTEFLQLDNDLTDIVTWYSDAIGNGKDNKLCISLYLVQTIHFYRLCKDYLTNHFPNINQVKITGHSLGGALAQLLILCTGYNSPVIAFNAPGCGHISGVRKEQVDRIYNIDSRYGIINKIGKSVGHIFIVDVPNKEAEAKAFFDTIPLSSPDLSGSIQFRSISEALSQLSKTPEVQKAYAQCDELFNDDYTSFAGDIQSLLEIHMANHICKNTAVGLEAKDIITAQHSMDNMVCALGLEANLSVANRWI